MGIEDFSIVIGTFGGSEWVDLASSRAVPSAEAQGVPVYHRHGATLAQARNEGLALAETEFVVHLDADDELASDYIERMAEGTADLRAPRLRQILRNGRERPVFMPQVWGHEHDCTGECLRFGNWIVIGAGVRTELLRKVGGWEEWGWSEDWAAWARCWAAGGTVEAITDAVYIAHHDPRTGRNHRLSSEETNRWHREIEAAIWPEQVAA